MAKRKRPKFLSVDVHERWKTLIAETSVVVLTPYFDKTLVRLLLTTALPASCVTVVCGLALGRATDFRQGFVAYE